MVNALADLVAGDCYLGTSAGEKVLPCIICSAVRAAQPFKNALGAGPANYLIEVEITVKDNASAGSTFDDLADSVHSRTAAAGFAASLSDDGLTIFGETEPAQIVRSVDGDVWIQTITLTMECNLVSTA